MKLRLWCQRCGVKRTHYVIKAGAWCLWCDCCRDLPKKPKGKK